MCWGTIIKASHIISGHLKNHLNSRHHKSLTMSIIYRYSVTNPNFLHIEDLLKTYVDDYNKKLDFI